MEPIDLRLWPQFRNAGGDISSPAIVDQITIDSRRIDSSQALFIPLPGKVYDGHKFIAQAAKSGAKYALAKKGCTPSEPLGQLKVLYVDDPLKAFQEIAKTYRLQFSCKVIAVAGSYGKTMVKDLLLAFLSSSFPAVASPESFNSQIGVPLSLLTINRSHQVAIIEAGISHKNEMDVLREIIVPECSIVTHIGKKHLTTLSDLHTVASEILKIAYDLPPKGWTLLPDNSHVTPFLNKLSSYYYWNQSKDLLPHAYTTSKANNSLMNYSIDFPDGSQHLSHITSGFYYYLDLLNITTKAAWLLGVPSQNIINVLKHYSAEPMRTEIWKSPQGTTFINDTYCSDPLSVDLALNHLEQQSTKNRRIFIFGGMRGHQQHLEADYRRVGKSIQRAKVDFLLLYGHHHYHSLIEELQVSAPEMEISQCATYKDALHLMRARLKQDDIVLIKGENKHSIDTLTTTFNHSICSNQYLINLAAIAENINIIRKKLPSNTRIMVMIKAAAYGTDEIRMAKFLTAQGIDILGVSYVDEGVVLKRAGVQQSVFVINAAVYEATKVVKWNLEVGVSSHELIESIAAEAKRQNKVIKVHLHVDTGMGRLGCRPEEVMELALLINQYPNLDFQGIMTHFPSADDPSQDDFTKSQAEVLDKAIHQLENAGISPNWRHAANSSAVARFDFPQFNMVRIGLAAYGLYASQSTKEGLELRPALTLISHIVGINTCKQGETISYGRSYCVERSEQRIAVLPIGYFDGLHRNYSGKGDVLIHGQHAPMVGKICMDFFMVDVTDIPQAKPGDPVLIFGVDEHGQHLSPEELADKGGSIVHELVTCLGPRIQRIFIYEEAN